MSTWSPDSRLYDWLLERRFLAGSVAVPHTLHVLVLGQEGVTAAGQQHHADQDRYDRLDSHDGRGTLR